MKLTPMTALALLFTFWYPVDAQSPSEARTLSIAGQPGSATIVEQNGKSYIALDDLARLIHGSLSFADNQIVLTLPVDQVAGTPPAKAGFSKAFLEAGIELMSTIREWRITVVNSIQNNSFVPEDWVSNLRRKADEKRALAAAARSTDDDRKAYPLLVAEFANMQKLSEQFLDKRRRSQYIDPKSIDNDPLDRQILACARSLSSMAADNQFHEEAACIELQ